MTTTATAGAPGTYRAFFTRVLQGLGLPATAPNLDALADVSRLEGANDRYNPLNSVVPAGNSTSFNSVGVQDYKSWANGITGTKKLLQGSTWAGVRSALAGGNSTSDVLGQFADVYQGWDPGVKFPTSNPAGVLNSILGTPGPAPAPSSGGTVTADPAKSKIPNPLSSAGSAVGNVVLKGVLVLGAVGLVGIGLARATGTHPVHDAAGAAGAALLA